MTLAKPGRLKTAKQSFTRSPERGKSNDIGPRATADSPLPLVTLTCSRAKSVYFMWRYLQKVIWGFSFRISFCLPRDMSWTSGATDMMKFGVDCSKAGKSFFFFLGKMANKKNRNPPSRHKRGGRRTIFGERKPVLVERSYPPTKKKKQMFSIFYFFVGFVL